MKKSPPKLRRAFDMENPGLVDQTRPGFPKEKRGKKMKKSNVMFLLFDYIITGCVLKCKGAFVK
jgi:hypothetical protein